MRLRPFIDQAPGSRREFTGHHFKGVNIDRRLVLAVGGVEMGTAPVVDLIVIDPDDDSLEGADPWHAENVRGHAGRV